jgi:hypothetical protein
MLHVRRKKKRTMVHLGVVKNSAFPLLVCILRHDHAGKRRCCCKRGKMCQSSEAHYQQAAMLLDPGILALLSASSISSVIYNNFSLAASPCCNFSCTARKASNAAIGRFGNLLNWAHQLPSQTDVDAASPSSTDQPLQQLFLRSVNITTLACRILLTLSIRRQVPTKAFNLPNKS